ncbi:MAG: AarF/ABC1/UbiB kinase family protein [Chloroflexi bacterium]|nr:MAG: AarF/ABC1/UbiB kinase family protein [Chloroflexota bacterium]
MARVLEDSPPDLQESGFELYMERRQRGIFGRFFETLGQLLALVFGGAFAYVRQKKDRGEGGSIGILLLRFVLIFAWPFLNKKIISQPFPVQFRMRLEQLGPTYIKLGQILSLREDLLPKSITDELLRLLDKLPAVSYRRLKELIVEDLRRPLNSMFVWIDPVPLGSASLAQTHRARLVTHEKVVIKVLKPGVREMVEIDTKLLRFFGSILQVFLGRYQPKRLINEFSSYTLREVDLRFEADNADTFAANFKNEPEIRFPKVYRQFSNRDVLCMEYFKGIKPDSMAVKNFSDSQRKKVLELGIRSTIEMIFRDGFFHADLHPANIVILGDAGVGFIDLGMVGQFDRDMRKRMFYYFFSLVMGDANSAARYLSSLAIPAKGTDIEGFRRSVVNLYSRWLRTPNLSEFSIAQVILQSVLMAGQFRVQYPGEIILMVKALVTVEGVGNLLEPGMNITVEARKPVQRILLNQFNPIGITRDIILVLPEMIDIISTTPLILSEGLKSFESTLKKPAPRETRSVRNALLAGFLFIAGAILVSFEGPWALSTALFIFAIILALRS